MKKRIFLLLSFCFVALLCMADSRSFTVVLTDKQPQYKKRTDFGNIYVSRNAGGNGKEYDVTIELENELDEVLCLFDKAYDPKALKRMGIKFEKRFPGRRGISKCVGIRNVKQVHPQADKTFILDLQLSVNSSEEVKLPYYVARYKNRKKKCLLLYEYHEVELKIEVQGSTTTADDDGLDRFESLCNSLLEDIAVAGGFCNNPNHGTSLEEQERPYRERRKELMKEAGERQRQYGRADVQYRRYGELWQQLDNIDFRAYEKDCGTHRKGKGGTGGIAPPVTCEYCRQSLEQIYNKMNEIDLQVFSGKVRKSALEKKMEAMYNCCRKHSSHAADWQEQGVTQQKIVKTFQHFKKL